MLTFVLIWLLIGAMASLVLYTGDALNISTLIVAMLGGPVLVTAAIWIGIKKAREEKKNG